ncbi:transposase [Streptomyces mobaraensis]|uniref:Transposase n=1 Tax=Streptomyces mobaraensis TaxID=35621 RepID=A0A5N5W2K8_STRMB|nr:transposase [Streptomyces mobaraensis]
MGHWWKPLLPPTRVGRKGGGGRSSSRRRIVDTIFSVMRTGRSRRQLPEDFAPCRRCTGPSRGGTTTGLLSATMTSRAARSVKLTAATRSRAQA